MLLEMNINAVFSLVNTEMEAFEQTLSLQKDGDGGFVKIPVIGTVAYNSIKEMKYSNQTVRNILRQYFMLYKEH